MPQETDIRALQERAKELRCLYRVHEIVSRRGEPPAVTFLRVLEVIPDGWEHPQRTGAQIEYLGRRYVGPGFSSSDGLLVEPIRVGGVEVGRISVSLAGASPSDETTPNVFLDEEIDLLRNIAARLGEYLEWKHTELLCERVVADGETHWRWRQAYSESLAAELDGEQFGVTDVYLGGSTEGGHAGPASDIDLYIVFRGSDLQRRELQLWLDGWSRCLAALALQQTGASFPEGVLNVHWLNEQPDVRHRPELRRLMLKGDVA